MRKHRTAIDAGLQAGLPRAEYVDSRVRLRRLIGLFGLLFLLILGRLAWLQVVEGPEFRRLSARPIERRRWIDGVRGRILTRDGAVLAEDRPVSSVAVDYRWLADPPDPAWLRRVARQRLLQAGLPLAARKDPARLTAEVQAIRAERDALQQRLAALCGCAPDDWTARVDTIRQEVTELAERVNARHQRKFAAEQQEASSRAARAAPGWSRWSETARTILFPVEVAAAPARITVAEEVADHIVVEGVSLEVVAEIEARPELYPATRIVQQSRRYYPAGDRAAHLVGHLGEVAAADLAAAPPADAAGALRDGDEIGRMGIEQQYDGVLRGGAGIELEYSDLAGRVLERRSIRPPGTGRDVVLTLDAALQSTAEQLLDAARERIAQRVDASWDATNAGGAIVVLDVRSGALLAAAAAPRFHPGVFQTSNARLIAACLHDPAAPLVDRTIKMALPPGSVFKVLTAIALLEEGVVQPNEPFDCRGYFRDPEHERCALFARHGEGHGSITLDGALVQSCNSYFFHHAAALDAAAFANWASRFGFGAKTGIGLAFEAAGNLPGTAAADNSAASVGERARALRAAVIGQGTVTATPLQVARFMAAVANGGRLVTPHVVGGLGLGADPLSADESNQGLQRAQPINEPHSIEGLSSSTLATIRRSLARVVDDPTGSAHASMYLDGLSIAGKTGTAETGGQRPDHAWFAGYAPADAPRVAFVVVLEHGGGGGEAAAPVARRIVQRLDQLGYLRGTRRPQVARHPSITRLDR